MSSPWTGEGVAEPGRSGASTVVDCSQRHCEASEPSRRSEALTRELPRHRSEAFSIGPGRVQIGWLRRRPRGRRISLEEARRFETVHEKTYRLHGFELIPISPGSVLDRVAAIQGVCR